MGTKMSPARYHGLVAFCLTLAGAVGLLFLLRFRWDWEALLASWLLSINIITFGYYGYDKAQAGRVARRVPELVLHALALAGGTIGAYLGMRLFRHKTIKGEFRVVFWFTVVLQVALIAAVIY